MNLQWQLNKALVTSISESSAYMDAQGPYSLPLYPGLTHIVGLIEDELNE